MRQSVVKNMKETFNSIVNIIASSFGIGKKEIFLESSFESLDLDEFDVIDLLFLLEEEFDIEIDDSEIENINLLEDLVKYIDTKINKTLKI